MLWGASRRWEEETLGDEALEVQLERLRGELRAGGGIRVPPIRRAHSRTPRAPARDRAAGPGGAAVAERVRLGLRPRFVSSREQDGP